MAKTRHFYIRKAHRYLGVVLGIQFLIWTLSGIYFSWTNIDEIHGDLQHKKTPYLSGNFNLISPTIVFDKIKLKPDSIQSLQLVSVLGQPYYSIYFYSKGKLNQTLSNALTGEVRSAISKEEAIQLAAESFVGTPNVKSIDYITSTDGHHEYRGKPLPAWAVAFSHPTNTKVYVSAQNGKVESFRNDQWRLFDFLWMGHTMDYKGRDNINNWLLRIFSAFGFVTVLSGFVLFWISSKTIKKNKRTIWPGNSNR